MTHVQIMGYETTVVEYDAGRVGTTGRDERDGEVGTVSREGLGREINRRRTEA